MHAVENFIMSRYQMYWQIYFHPVSRGGEVLLNNCLKRAKQLYNEGYEFKLHPHDFIPLKRQLRLNNMLNSMKR
ncbi:hypothetical protein ACVNP1_15110 [Staphylococcus aureus]